MILFETVKKLKKFNKRKTNHKKSGFKPSFIEHESIGSLRQREKDLRVKLAALFGQGAKDLIDSLDPSKSVSALRTIVRNLVKDLESGDRLINSLERVSRKVRDFDSKNNKESYYIEANTFEGQGHHSQVISGHPTTEAPNPVWGYDDYGAWKIIGYGK